MLCLGFRGSFIKGSVKGLGFRVVVSGRPELRKFGFRVYYNNFQVLCV